MERRRDSRDRYDRGRSPARRDRDREDRDKYLYGREDYRFRSRSRSRSKDRNKIEKEKKPQSKAAIEAARQERLALVKKLTHADEDDDKQKQLNKTKEKKQTIDDEGKILEDGEAGEDEEEEFKVSNEEDVMLEMGFVGFGTTKGKGTEENRSGVARGTVSKHKDRKYRQYMNRKGGFNRPLAKMS